MTLDELEMSGNYTVAGVSAVDTVIEQQATERVVNVIGGADITLSNLTLTGADTSNYGGGLFIEETSTARLESVIIRNNVSAIHGGGVYNAGFLEAQDVRLTQNTSIEPITVISEPSALVLNAASERLYWVDSNSNPDPGVLGVQDLTDLTISSVDTSFFATGITFDTLNDRVIITTGDDGKIFSYDEDLGNSLELYSSAAEAGSIAYLGTQITAPQLIANTGATLDEGSSTTFSEATLLFEDDDTDSIDLTYTIKTEPEEGEIQRSGTKISTFTQKDINEGRITYLNNGNHVGYETDWTDSFISQISDGVSTYSNQQFTLSIDDVDDATVSDPLQSIEVDESGSVSISNVHLQISDVATPDDDILITISNQIFGELKYNNIAITSFNLSQLKAGGILFEHDGSDPAIAAGFDFTLTSEGNTSDIIPVTISEIDADAPALETNNGLSLDEDSSTMIAASELEYTVVGTPPSAILYTASGLPTGGKLLVDSTEQLTFTQDDLDTGKVFYQDPDTHAGFGSSWTQSFNFVVSNSNSNSNSTIQTFTLTINDEPDAPVFTPSVGVALPEGGRIKLLPAHLVVTDVGTPSDKIAFTVTDSYAGQLLVDGVEEGKFTQADLIAGLVSFEHDGSEPSVEASIGFMLTDGATVPRADSLVFSVSPVHDETPVATDHELSGNQADLMSQLQTGSFSLLDGVTDNDEPAGELFVRLETTALHGKVSINADGTFSYLHDGSETFSDSFTYSITDEGGNTSSPATVSIAITSNATPITNGSIGPSTATEMQAFSLTLDANLFSDTADDSLLWQASLQDGSTIPAWLSFDSTSRTFSGTPDDADTGRVDLQVLAVDSHGAESSPVNFTLMVVDVNQAPVLTLESPSTVMENQPGVAISSVIAMDPDRADSVSVTVNDERFQITGKQLSLKPGLSLDHEAEAQIMLTITASDESGETVDRQFPVQVQDGNDIPVLLTDVQDIALKRESVTLIPVDWFSDEDGDPLTYTWKLASGADLPEWIMFDEKGSTLSLGELPDDESTQSVVLTASDGRGGVAQLFLDLQLPPLVIAPANPVVEAAPVEQQAEVLLSAFDLDELPSDNSTAGANVPKDSLISDETGKSKANPSVAALGVSASGIIPLIVDVDPVSAEDLSERIQSIKDTRVISDQIGDGFKSKRVDLSKPSMPDVLHSTTNLSDLFSSVQRLDVQTLSELAREFQQQREEMESRENFHTAVVGSSITLSSGL